MEVQEQVSVVDRVEQTAPRLDVCVIDADGSPISLAPADYQEFAENFVKALACTVNPMGVLVGEPATILSVDNVEQSGEGYSIATQDDQGVEQGIRNLLDAIQTKDYDRLSTACIYYLQELANIAESSGCDFKFSTRNLEVDVKAVTAGASSSFALPERTISCDDTLYGKLLDIGVDNSPMLKLELSNGSILSFSVSKPIADSLKTKLNKEIGLEGKAYWRLSDWQLVDFTVSEVSPYDEDSDMVETFAKLRNIINGRWDDIKDVDAYVHNLRGGM